MLLPALIAIKRNRIRDDITEADAEYALQSIREIVEDLGEQQAGAAHDSPEGESAAAGHRAPGPGLRLPGARRRGSVGAGDAPATARSGTMASRSDPHGNPDRRAPRPGGGSKAGRRLHRGDPARRPGPHPISLQAPAVPVPGPAHRRGPLGSQESWQRADLLQKPGAEPDEATPSKGGTAVVTATLQAAGADFVAPTLLETRQQLCTLLPVLLGNQRNAEPDGADSLRDDGASYVEAGSTPSRRRQGDGGRKAVPSL